VDKDSVCKGRFSDVSRSLIVVALAAFLLKIAIALFTYGSVDVLLFEADLTKIRRDGAAALYRDGVSTRWCGQVGQAPCPPFIHPPFVIHALEGWGLLSRMTGLPLGFWLRFTCAVADVGSLALLVLILSSPEQKRRTRIALLFFAGSPISILVSGFHGNTDPILIFLTLLSIHLLESRRPAWHAGVALGMAAAIKIVPVLLGPIAVLSLLGLHRKFQFVVGATFAFFTSSLPFLVTDPELVVTRVFGYGSSQFGSWGLSLLAVASQESTRLVWMYSAYSKYGKVISLCLVLGASLWLSSRSREAALFYRAGFLMFLFVSSIPGFGVQYLSWLVPWVVALGAWPTATYYMAGAVFMGFYYHAAAGTFPWHFANGLARSPWTNAVIGLGLICWVVVCCNTLVYARRLLARRSTLLQQRASPRLV